MHVSLGRSFFFHSSDQPKFQKLQMNRMNSAKQAKCSPSNITEYEKLYMKEHYQAMGYITRDVLRSPAVKTAKTVLDLYMEEYQRTSTSHSVIGSKGTGVQSLIVFLRQTGIAFAISA